MASPLPSFERLPCPTVQLVHELPGGDSHIDWMLARDPDGGLPLLSFRVTRPVHELDSGRQIAVKRIGDHRPAYLDYEGPVSNNRGSVSRLATGDLFSAGSAEGGAPLELRIRWRTRDQRQLVQHLQLARSVSDQWLITCVSSHELPTALAAGALKEES